MLPDDDVAAEREAEAGSLAGRLGGEVGIEHALAHVCSDSRPVVADGDLDGVADVMTMDAAVQLGPGLAWSASGPHLTRALGAGPEGISRHVAARIMDFQERWQNLAKWDQLSPEEATRIEKAIDRAYTGRIRDLRQARDERLVRGLESADKGPTGGWPGDLDLVRPPEGR